MLTLSEAAPLLGCRDPRTARKRLGALGVPVVSFGGRLVVDPDEIQRALRAHARPLTSGTTPSQRATIDPLPSLWDLPSTKQVAPRRVNVRGRGDRELHLRAAREAYPGSPGASAVSTSRSSPTDRRTP